MIGKPFDRIQLEIPQILKPTFLIMLYQSSILTDGIHPNIAFVIFTCVQFRPCYNLSDEIIASKIGISRDSVDVNGGSTVSFSPYLRIVKRRCPDTCYTSIYRYLPLSILAYLCLDKVAFKLRPMDEEFGLLEISGDGIESKNLVDVVDSAVLYIY